MGGWCRLLPSLQLHNSLPLLAPSPKLYPSGGLQLLGFARICPCISELNFSKGVDIALPLLHTWSLSKSTSVWFQPLPVRMNWFPGGCASSSTTGPLCSDSLLWMCTCPEKPEQEALPALISQPSGVRRLQSSESIFFHFLPQSVKVSFLKLLLLCVTGKIISFNKF